MKPVSHIVKRRYATCFAGSAFRGLKSTATLTASLREAQTSRSDDVKVAVGFSPRTLSLKTSRHVVTLETLRDLPKDMLIGIVRIYRSLLSPLLHFLCGSSGACRHSPTCSCYAIEAFQRHGALHGLWLTTRRLLRCNPWGSAGYDPVPSSRTGGNS